MAKNFLHHNNFVFFSFLHPDLFFLFNKFSSTFYVGPGLFPCSTNLKQLYLLAEHIGLLSLHTAPSKAKQSPDSA